MKAQLEELSDTRLRLNTKGNGKTKDLKKKIKDLANELKKKTRKKGTKSSNEAKYAWKNKNPGEKSKMNKDGKTYYWCTNHNQGAGMWVLHKPEDCRNRDDSEETDNNESVNMANRGIAEMESSDDDESETESTA